MGRDRTAQDYEAVPLDSGHDGAAGQNGQRGQGALLRRRSAWRDGAHRHRRAVIYLLCAGDDFVTDDVVSWYTGRGFQFYAADLRDVGGRGGQVRDSKTAAEDLEACFGCLDATVAHLRGAGEAGTTVVSAHGAGALVAALWCHARRGSRPADALILARPLLTRPPLGGWVAWRGGSPMIANAQRRLRQGLDISCPVLVMCPAADRETAGGALVSRVLGRGGATIRLGEHVTWLDLAAGLPGQPEAGGPGRRRYFEELSRWLGAYLSGQIRDQLL